MVLVAVCVGLRVSEIMGLQWGDFDWGNQTVLVQRGVVHGHVGETKTEYSRRPMPLDPALAQALCGWRERSMYPMDSGWVFANNQGKPRWQECILEDHLKPAAERAKNRQARLAHAPAHLLNDVAVLGRRYEGAAGAVATRQHPDHDEHLHPGGFGCQAGSQQQSRAHGPAGDRASKKAARGGLALNGI